MDFLDMAGGPLSWRQHIVDWPTLWKRKGAVLSVNGTDVDPIGDIAT